VRELRARERLGHAVERLALGLLAAGALHLQHVEEHVGDGHVAGHALRREAHRAALRMIDARLGVPLEKPAQLRSRGDRGLLAAVGRIDVARSDARHALLDGRLALGARQ